MEIRIEESLGMDIIHAFFALLDSVVYGWIASCYDFIYDLTGVWLADSMYEAVSNRVYTILSIFMLFKVSCSFINYIVNPDAMTDKEKGVQNVIKNIIIMFVMLLVAPWGFKQLYGLQDALISEGIVERFIFGNEGGDITFQMSEECGSRNFTLDMSEQRGEFVSLTLFKPFYSINGNPSQLDHEFVSGENEYCPESYQPVSDYLVADVYNNAPDWFNGDYAISYLFGISTAVGIVALLIIISMLIDIALRAVKLIFLQLIAPIPIISYIDPKSGKSGMFKKWIKEVGTTWASLFIKLLAFNFAVFMIQLFMDEDGGIVIEHSSIFVYVFLILGALMFAKQLPKLIQDITGFNINGGGFSVNPLKKISNEALGGKFIAGATTAGLAMGAASVGSGVANLANARMNGKNWRESFKSAGKGLGTGLYYGAKNGYKDGASGKYNFAKSSLHAVKENSQSRNYSDFLGEQGMKGPFKVSRNRASSYLKELTGTAGTSGDTNVISDRKKELKNSLAVYEERVDQYGEAIGNMVGNNPNKSVAYLKAIERTSRKDENGKYVNERVTKDYSSFMASQFNLDLNAYRQQSLNDCVASISEWNTLDEATKEQYIREDMENRIQHQYGNDIRGLTINEYSAINAADLAKAEAQKQVAQIKKDITKIENNATNKK